jgi:hypothetical protein
VAKSHYSDAQLPACNTLLALRGPRVIGCITLGGVANDPHAHQNFELHAEHAVSPLTPGQQCPARKETASCAKYRLLLT